MSLTFDVLDYGAVADGIHDDRAAIQRTIDAAAAAGGGRVLIPAGAQVRAGSFELRSHVELHVAEGAMLLSATNIEAFPQRVFSFGEEADKRIWIGARHATDIILSGKGTIDGQCLAFALGETEHIYKPTVRWRPAMTCFEDVQRLQVCDLTFRDAANWTLHFSGCQDVEVSDIKIFNNIRFPNADGIDPDHCQRVRIRRCHIVSGDDCIVLKNTAPFAQYGPCEDIEISDCRLESASAAFKIGSESHDDFRRVRVRDCVIERSNRGLAIQLRDGGSVEDIEFSNISVETRRYSPDWWGAGEAIYVTALPRNDATCVGAVRDIRFRNIRCSGENGIVVYADPDGRIGALDFENVHIGIERTTQWPAGLLDVRPFKGSYRPLLGKAAADPTPWGHPVQCQPAAVLILGAREVNFRKVTCSLPDGDGGSAGWQLMHGDPALPRPLLVGPADFAAGEYPA